MTKYKIYSLNDETGIRYLGVTGKTLKERLRCHIKTPKENNPYKWNWIRKNLEKIEIKLLFECTNAVQAYKLEKHLIEQCKKGNINLVNIAKGDRGGQLGIKRSKSTRKKLSNLRKGKKLSSAHKEAIRRSMLGKNLGNKGRTGQKHLATTIEKMKYAAQHRKCKVLQFCKDNKSIKIHNSITEAAKEIKINRVSIQHVLSGKNKTAGGFFWKKLLSP